MKKHAPGCVLDPVHWLRHAIAASGRLVSEETPQDQRRDYDRASAMSILDTLAHFAELPEWRTVTLLDVAEQATLMHDDSPFAHQCTCGANPVD